MEAKWISVKDRLPEPHIHVIAHYAFGLVSYGYVQGDGSWAFERMNGKVTHWMPMPEPPERDE